VLPALLEREVRARHEISHRSGHEHLAGRREACDAGADVDGDARDTPVAARHFAGMQPAANVETATAYGVADIGAAPDRPGRAVEDREHSVAGGIDDLTAVRHERLRTVCSKRSRVVRQR
jgi:hypothetical protein